MAEPLFLHHGLGPTAGCISFADEIRAVGHVVHAPDLCDGKVFTDLTDGVGYAEQIGFESLIERGRLAAESLPKEIVYAEFSLGVLPAQMLAQTLPGANRHCCFKLVSRRPISVPVAARRPAPDPQLDSDERLVEDLEAARHLAATIESTELFLYPGDRHLFADNSQPDYDKSTATLLKQRVLTFLDEFE